MTNRKVMQMALDALELRCGSYAEERSKNGAITALREALAQPDYFAPPTPEVPVGWKLVPIEPTPIMMQSGTYAERYSGVRDIYKAMLATAPRIAEGVRFEGTVLQQTGG